MHCFATVTNTRFPVRKQELFRSRTIQELSNPIPSQLIPQDRMENVPNWVSHNSRSAISIPEVDKNCHVCHGVWLNDVTFLCAETVPLRETAVINISRIRKLATNLFLKQCRLNTIRLDLQSLMTSLYLHHL